MGKEKGTWLATLVFGLALSLPALAKEPSKPLLPELTANKTSPSEKIISGQGANRFIEMLIELAWLADPVTFPYYLEARVEGSALQVRGFVPGTSVRDQALKVAPLPSPL